jgi:hypothetical protein
MMKGIFPQFVFLRATRKHKPAPDLQCQDIELPACRGHCQMVICMEERDIVDNQIKTEGLVLWVSDKLGRRGGGEEGNDKE